MNKKLALLALSIGLYTASASAQIFKLTFQEAVGMAPQAVTAIKAELEKIEKEINDGLPSAESPDRLMDGMANSSVMAGKGIGADYASDMQVMLIGVGVGVGADLEKNKEAKTDLSGAGVQGGFVIGTNLKWMDTAKILGLDTNKLNVYGNFFKYELEKNSGDVNVNAQLASYGIHFSYDLVKASPSKLFGWGGVKVHTGYEYNRTTLTMDSKISESMSATVSGDTYASAINATPKAQIDVATQSIPIEISSSLRLLYILSLYGGLGADYNLGTATGKGALSNTSNVTCTGATCSPSAGTVGTINTKADIDGDGKVNPFLFRGFVGVQVNIPFVRIFVQADKSFGNELVAASTGIRFVY